MYGPDDEASDSDWSMSYFFIDKCFIEIGTLIG
jgi:hypothetical protein